MKKLYIVDAVAYLFRSYYAIRGMSNKTGQSTNAVYGFVRSILKVLKDFNPDHLVCVFDGPNNKASRVELYEAYKGHREGMPEDLVEQLELAHRFCELYGIPMLSIEGVEADDVMGSIAKWGELADTEVFLLSSDKDLAQLVDDKIKLLNTHKDNLLIDSEKVKEIYGVRPDQVIDLLAIMGDASDNIPGIPGFGPKTAVKLLDQFGSLENMLANVDQIDNAKRRQKVIDHTEDARISYKLATIQLDVPFPKESAFFALHEGDPDELRRFYEEMNFNTLVKEMAKPQAPSEGSYTLIDTPERLEELLKTLKQPICVDTETTSLSILSAEIVGIGLGDTPGTAYYVPFTEPLAKLLKPFLESTPIYGHNIKYDLHALANHGIHPQHVCYDTMLASYTLHAENRHSLDHLALEHFGKVKTPIKDLIGTGKKEISMRDVPIEKITHYCCEDVDYTMRLKELFDKELDGKLRELFFEMELPLLKVLYAMERAGIFVDQKMLSVLSSDFRAKTEQLQAEIYQLAGEEFNIKSPKQLSEILFNKLEIKPKKKGTSTSADVLEAIRDDHPIIEKVLFFRTFDKLRSTYVDKLPEQIDQKTGRIHPTFTQTVTATGRLSCQNPNLQNIPVRSEEGRKIRFAFIPEKSASSFISFDYSQIELRILAHLCEDPHLVQAFHDDDDIHRVTAALLFGVEDVVPQMRHAAKAVNFGIIYGQGAYGLSRETGMSVKDAKSFIETYFKTYPRVKEFIEGCKERARKEQASYTVMGRKRALPDILSTNGMLRSQAERLAVNSPIQGTQADIIKLAMIEINTALSKNNLSSKLILQIHDELIFETPDSEIDQLKPLVSHAMESIYPLKVPLKVDIKIGKNWGEC
ncbi:MAG: DNA polymerase I [Simkaniaceae bacterium]|nr:DNA polymerase I [Simkaniaceae bacterium]